MKNYKIKKENIKNILVWYGNAGCYASDRIVVDGCKVGYMYRETPENDDFDSGWRFLAGDEDEDYLDDPSHFDIYDLNTICNYDSEIISLLDSDFDKAFYRDENGVFIEDNLEKE